MIVDTSALMAILRNEPEALQFGRALESAKRIRLSAGSYVEGGMVIDHARDAVVSRRLDDLIQMAGIEIAPVTVEHARVARAAYRDFGRGSGHPAKLNFGDCFSYALAKEQGESLLYKGNDFGHTDVHGVRG